MAHEGEWNADLFGCMEDLENCCFGFWCTPCLFGKNAEKLDDSSCIGMCLAYWILGSCYLCWVPHYMKREKLREKYHLKPNPCGDCPTTLLCSPCALCQEAREMKSRENQQPVSYATGSGTAVVTQPRGDVNGPQPSGQRV